MVLKEDKYTEKARRVVFFARYEASQRDDLQVTAEHLLLGVLRADPELLRMLSRNSADVISSIQTEIESIAPTKPKFGAWAQVPPFSDPAENSLTLAATVSESLGHHYIGTEHILLGLIRYESRASIVLSRLGFDANEVTTKICNGSLTEQNGQDNKYGILKGHVLPDR